VNGTRAERIPRPSARRKAPAGRGLRGGAAPTSRNGDGYPSQAGARDRSHHRHHDDRTDDRPPATPGTRGWHANLLTHPEFIFHLKGTVRADLRARATPILDPAGRRTILSRLLDRLGHATELDAWVRESPLVEVEILESEHGSGPARPSTT
jgi:hypothetical protein